MSSKKKIVLYSAERVFSSRQQARIIRDEAVAMLETANEFSSTSRRVGKRSAFKVIARSLESTRGLPFSIRKHKAITELSNYISLAKHNKINGLVAFNTDLLPISHPKSTRPSSMTASAILESQMLWVTDDPRITDPEAKALIASAMMSHPDSPEHIYSMKRIELLPQGTVPLEALVASYGDGNSRAAKSARAKLQRRDRKGRFAEMFGTFKVILGLRDGGRASATGRILGQNIFSPDLLDMELSDGRIAAIPISQGEQPKAMLDDTSDEARKSGFVRVSGANYDAKAPVVPEDNLTFIDAPSGFRLDKDYKGAGKKYTDEAFDVVIYDKPSKDTRDVIDNAIKRSRERDLADPKQVKLGEDGKIWDENRKLFSVTRRDEQTPFVFSQNWNDSIEEIARIEKIDDSQERFGQGEDEENSPLADQLKGKPKKAKARIADEGAKTSEGFKYNVPEGSIELDPDFDYVPEGTEDDPSRLAETYDKSELMDGLVDGLEPVNATTPAVGLGRLSQDDKDEDLEVPVEAILSALKEQGSDGKSALAEAYDKINKNKENQNALKDSRKGEKKAKAAEPKDIADVFPEVATEPAKPEEEAPIEEPTEDIISEQTELSLAEKLDQMPALESLSKEEKQSIIDDNNNYSKYLPKNENVAMPEGMYQPKESTEKDRTDAIDLASSLGENLTKEDLTDNLEDAIKNEGTAEFLSSDENGESSEVFISAEALRDALALRGEDANKIIKDIAERNTPATKEPTPEEKPAKEKKKKAKKEEPAAPPTPPTEPPAEDPAAEEEKPKKTTNYKRVGNRTLIRAGKGKPFSDKEVKDFLTENGFVFSDTVERDGRTIPVKAETAIQTDEEFKAFMRELRDRFGIELEPRKETAFSPAQEPIDFDAPEPGKPVVEEVPTPAEEEKPTPSTKPLPSGPKITEDKSKIPNELPDILPEGWTKDANRIAKNDDGSLLLLIDQSGNKYWVLVADGLGTGKAFNSPQEALDYYEKNIKGRESSVKPVDLDKLRDENKRKESERRNTKKDIRIIERALDSDTLGPADRKNIEEELKKLKENLIQLEKDLEGKPSEADQAPTVAEDNKDFDEELKSDKEFKDLLEARKEIQKAIDEADLSKDSTPEEKRALREAYNELTRRIDAIVLGDERKLRDLIEKRRKVQKQIDDADSSNKATAEQKKELRDLYDRLTRQIDAIILGEDSEKEEGSDADAAVDTAFIDILDEESDPRDVALDRVLDNMRSMLKLSKGEKKDLRKRKKLLLKILYSTFGPSALRLDSRDRIEVKNFLFELNKLSTEDLEYIGKGVNEELGWEFFRNLKETVDRLDSYIRYEGIITRIELGDPINPQGIVTPDKTQINGTPEVQESLKEFTPDNTLHVVNSLGKDLKAGDIAFLREGDELVEFFVVEEVLPGTVMTKRADGKPDVEQVQIRGYYPGHQSQVKGWSVGTSVEAIRGEKTKNIPAMGDKPEIPSIPLGSLKGKAYQDKKAEISAVRKEAGKVYTPNLKATDIPAVLVAKPNSFASGSRPAFFGKAAELANLKDGKAISDALKGKRVVFFDFETIGTGKFDSDNPDAPIQVAASVFEGGEKVGEINLFINPREALGKFYYIDEDPSKGLDPAKLLTSDGTPVDDAFLASQPSIEEQLRKFAEFAGQDAIFVAHNAEFDTNTFEKWAKKFGIDYNMDGVIDTLELAKSMTPKGNKLGQVAKRYGIEKTDEEWHDARTDSEVLPQILEGLLADMKPDNKEFDNATRLAEFEAKRSSYNEKMEAFKKQEAELVTAEAVKRGMSGEQVSIDEMLGKDKTTSGFGSEGSTDSAEEYALDSIFGEKINNSWIEDDENTFIVDEGGATVGDIKIGDFVPAEGGGYHEVIDLQQDPEDPNGTIVVRRIVATGEFYSTRVKEKKSPGIGWSNGQILKGTLRRRNGLSGKTAAEIKDLASKPVVVAPEPKTKEKTPTPKGKKSITPEETQSVVSDAIETITSGSKSDATVKEAVKALPVDDTVKSLVLADRPDASINHLSASGVALKVGDEVRGVKTGRIGTVRALITSYGSRGYKNYVKVKFNGTEKRENISAGSLESINPDDGSGFFADPTPPKAGETLDPNTSPKSKEDLASLLDGKVPEGQPTVEIPEEPVVPDREKAIAYYKEKEVERMKYALELNYRQVSPEALQSLTAAVSDISKFEKGHTRSFTSFMPNLSTGEPLERSFTFVKPSKEDLKYHEYLEEDDIIVKTGPVNTAAVIKSDGKILYLENPNVPNWKLSVVSPDLNTALENKNAVNLPLGENPDLPNLGMISFNQEFLGEVSGSPDETPDPDFVVDSPDAAPKGIKPTKQQQAVIDAIVSGKDVIVQALAGTGKTSTLKMAAKAIAEKDPDKTILYIAFNKAVAAELNADPDRPSNMVARTNTQVAWHHSPAWMQKRSFDKTSIFSPTEVADHLGVGPVKVTEVKKDGTKADATLSSREVVAVVRQAVTAFAQSADEKIMPRHFTDNFVDIPEVFIDYANRWWDDISSPKGKLAMNQSFPEKYVQLNGIDVTMSPNEGGLNPNTRIPAADIIFFDEAQDINDVAGDWVRKQKVQKVFVGDGNQSIYGFRGAKDQLDTLEGADKLQITESFRFGPNIAAPANRFLAVAGKSEKIVGAGKDQGELVEGMEDPDAVLVRTNGGGFKAMLEYLEQDKVVGISQSTKARLEEVIETTSWLMGGKKGSKPAKYNAEIGMYDSWEELSTAVREGKARPVKAFYDLVTQNGMQSIRDILDRVVVEREETAESKLALTKYKPLTLDLVEDGSTGKLDKDTTYKIEGDDVVLTGFFKFNNEKLKEAGFKARKGIDGNWAKDRRITIEDNLNKVDKLNQLKKILEGVIEPVKADVVITTAHQSKGLQWNKVRIYDDFWGPKFNKETGDIDMPAPEELRLAYVAVTRAQKQLDLGPLTWVNDYTTEEDEQAISSSFNVEAMSNINTDPTPVTPEEFDNEVQETAKKADPATQRIADAIIAALEAGTAPWRKPWAGGGVMPTSVATGKMYEGSNILSLWAAQAANGWADNRWLTYKQAEKLGGNIKRGEKATSIIHWTPKFKDVKQPNGTTEKVFVYTPPKIINVFNVEQAEGVNLPPLVKGEPVPVGQGEQAILDAYKDRPEIFYKSQDSAYYSPITDTIHLPLREQFGTEQDIFETLVHELAHSTGHTSRVNRKDLTDNYGTHRESRGEEELIAEISVAIAAARLGVEIDFGNVASYAKSWLGSLKNDPTMIIKAAKQAQKAVDHMLGKQEEPAKFDEEGNPVEPVGEGVGSEGKTGDQIAEDAGLKPEPTPEPNVGEQGKTGEEIAREDDIKPAGTKGGHNLSPREVFNKQSVRSDVDIKKVYGAEDVHQPQLQRDVKQPVAPKREDFQDRDSYVAAYKKYSKEYDDMYRESSRNIQSSIGEKNLDGSQKGVQNYVKDVITADWFVETFGDGGQMGRPPVSLITSKKAGGKYIYGFKNGVYKSALKINSLLSKSEPSILHEIAHFATAISVGEGFDAHGVEYRMNYIFITNKVLGRESAESLKEAYRKANLNVG